MATTLATATRVPGLVLELRTDTQDATAYLCGRPFATVQRARHGSDAPRWQAYRLDGTRFAHAASAATMVRMVETAAAREGEPAPACAVELAPDYELRSDLRLAMARTFSRATRRPNGWTLAGYVPGHMFMRLRYLGGDAPTFRRQSDLAEWCALVGLTAAAPIRGRRGCYRFGDALQSASPVATFKREA